MTGILLIFVVWLWYLSARWMARRMINKLPERWRHVWVKNVAFIFLLILPLGDEIVGGIQFKKLCRDHSMVYVHPSPEGKTVYLNPNNETLVPAWIPIHLLRWEFVDVTTKEVIVSYDMLRAKGGWFIRTLGISQGNAPLIFKSYCAPNNAPYSDEAFEKMGITVIEHYKK